MYFQIHRERVCTCPTCFADNTLVSGDLDPKTEILCSHCGERIGTVADMRDAHVSLARIHRGEQQTLH